MRAIIIFFFIVPFLLLSSCQTVQKKSQQAIKKENEKLSKFLHQPESELKIVMGLPDQITYNEKGSKILVYISKKYSVTCERRFEIDKNKMIVGFSSEGCF